MQLTPPIQGTKKGNKAPKKPHIQKDTAASVAFFKGLYGLCEGEIAGLADGGKSICLDGTPIINANGTPNFEGVKWSFRSGTLRQEHIAGFPSVENETAVNVELRHDRPFVKYFNNTQLSALRVRLNWNALRQTHDNGDVTGYRIDYAIDVQTDGGQFVEVLKTAIHDKTSQGYKRSHRIDLPSAKRGWSVRVRRLTANADSELISDKMTVDAVTEIIDAKLTYPCTALLGLEYDAQTFSSIAKLAVRLKGKLIQVPSNYNADTRQYTGLWDGTFKLEYSNNPAWVYYDLCTHKRYGLGERLAGLVDKWSLYRLAQYCDALVDDGKGGTEPRFTCNVYIQKAEDAYQILQNIASIFRAMSYWNGEQIVVDSDVPKEAVYTFSRANVVGGEFSYTGTRTRDRHSVIQVGWDNPDNDFKTEYEFVRDERAIAKYGIKKREINAFGCTSRGQATRVGKWALLSEQLETRTVQFKTGLMGFIPQVGQVINIADDVFAGRAISGQVLAVSSNQRQITLDRPAGKAGDTLMVNGKDGTPQKAIITAVNDTVLTVNPVPDIDVGAIWAIVSDDLRFLQFRIMSIKQNDDATFDVEALQYDSHKFALSDKLGMTPQAPYSVLKPEAIQAPEHIAITATSKVVQGVNITTLNIGWSQVKGAVGYIVQWRKDDGNWITLPKTASQSLDIEGVYAGNYMARVRALDAFDNESLATSSQLTHIAGKTGRPPRLARLTATGLLFAMRLEWVFNKGSGDTAYTEIQVSPDGRSNIATLGTFAYPTNSHTINGLQGNLTQHYRARIVDKLGNVSDWTAWVSGTTDAQADKVLDLLQGQISQSHLDQSLRTPIGKIGGLETAVAGVNGQLGTLNQSLATAQRELSTAQNTLNTAVANITTERNRITSAIRDITALQSANTAKTAELASLKQTVNGHTSSIRELGVTTGDLSQKYSQIKTQADKSTSDITQIKQTQSGQATSIDRLGANYTALDNRSKWTELTTAQDLNNLTTQGNYFIRATNNTNAPHNGWLYVRVDVPRTDRLTQTAWADNNPSLRYMRTRSGTTWHGWQKQATGSELDSKASSASLTAEQKARADADSALSGRINALDSKFTTADNTIKASIATAQQTATNAQQALATTQSQLNAKIDGINVGGRNLLLGSHATRSTHGTTAFSVSQNIDLARVRQLVLSCDVKYTNARRASTQGAKWFRIGAEIRLVWTDGTSKWYGAWRANVANASSFHGRVALKISVPAGKTIKAIDNAKIQIWDILGDGMLVKNAKLEIGNTPTDYTPAPEDTSVAIGAVQASVDEFKSAQATKDNATAAKLSQLESNLNSKANASALNQTNTKVSQAEGRITAEANKVSTLQTTVNGHTASIQQHTQSINGLRAQWTLKVESGGIVSGIGLASANGNSAFAVRANKFYVADPTGTTKRPMFSVLTSPQTINGVTVPAGTYISSAYIQNGSITTAKIGHAQIDTLQVKDGAIIVPRVQYNAGFRTFHQSNEIEVGRITIDAKGGNVMIGFGFQRLFSLPNGAYSWGAFVPAIDETNLHNFVHGHVYDNTYNRVGNVSFHIRRNGVDIHNVFFRPNYTKNDSTALSWLNINRETPILLYDQYSSPAIVDNPPSGNTTYTLLMVVFSSAEHFNNDRNVSRRTILKGLSFSVMGVKR